MNKEELSRERGIDVEEYGGGFILADYSGERNPRAVFHGANNRWRTQPVGLEPFDTIDDAVKFANKMIQEGNDASDK